jgi:hypothetical protein
MQDSGIPKFVNVGKLTFPSNGKEGDKFDRNFRALRMAAGPERHLLQASAAPSLPARRILIKCQKNRVKAAVTDAIVVEDRRFPAPRRSAFPASPEELAADGIGTADPLF